MGVPPVKTLLLGMGNPILRDDAIGCRLARDYAARRGPRPDIDVIPECCVGGLNLLDVVAGNDRLVVFDAIRTPGATPGTWCAFGAGALRETVHLSSIHDANFATALELGRRMGARIPAEDQCHIFAVEVEDVTTFDEAMTPLLEGRYPVLSQEIFDRVDALLGPPPPV